MQSWKMEQTLRPLKPKTGYNASVNIPVDSLEWNSYLYYYSY